MYLNGQLDFTFTPASTAFPANNRALFGPRDLTGRNAADFLTYNARYYQAGKILSASEVKQRYDYIFEPSPPSLTFDGFNKYTFTGADTGSTYKLKYGSNTYDLGTISNVYIANPGTYSAEIKGATNFALSSNVVGTVASTQKNYGIQDQVLDAGTNAGYSNGDASQGGYGNSIDMSADGTRMVVGNAHYTDSNGRVWLYHLENGSWVLKQTWDGGTRLGSQVAMNEAGTRVFAIYNGGGVKIWDYSSGAWDTSASGA